MFNALSGLSLVAAAYHLLVLIGAIPRIDGSPLRHLVFVGFGIAGAAAFRVRPRWFPAVFIILTVQQLHDHGLRAWRWWSTDRSLDWLSFVVLITMPVACVLLVRDALRRRPVGR